MRRIARKLTLCLALAAPLALPLAGTLGAQARDEMATLTADRVEVSGTALLVASGGVTMRYQGQTLQAASVTYDRAADQLRLVGPILLTDAKGTRLLADAAELSADLRSGVMTSARMVLNDALQIAANRITRSQGRYTELSTTVASSCQVCSIAPTPLWEIRAARVIHDSQERQLYFDRAQLRFGGIPVIYVPRLRVPDPSLKRAQGLLMPRFRSNSDLGYGLETPYFIPLGDSRDLTLTPYITTKNSKTLSLRYRQAFNSGLLQFDGALSHDRLLAGQRRGYVNLAGAFALPQGFKLDMNLRAVSDPAYLLDYGLSDEDRIISRVEISRTRRNEYISGQLHQFRTIREGETNATLPSLVGDLTFHRRFSGGPLGGEGGLTFQTHSHYRTSSSPFDGAGDDDLEADGRDVLRASVALDWRRNFVFGPGILGAVLAEGRADLYHIQQDALFAGEYARLNGAVAAELRWPWSGQTADGASHVIEPVVQLVAAPRRSVALPNEDSRLVEFDEGNLFALDRFAGTDAHEGGQRANIGISWTRIDADGWSLGTTLGRVLRRETNTQFTAASGLDGRQSDWLAAMQLTGTQGIGLTNRLLFDDNFDLTKAEFRLDLERDRYGLSSSYVRMQADAGENRLTDTEELYLDGHYALTPNWTAKAANRYDLVAERASSAALGAEFRNECVAVDLSLSRRFTSSTNVKPSTDFSLSVNLLGFGGSGTPGPARKCGG